MNWDNYIRAIRCIQWVMGRCRTGYDHSKWFLSFGTLLGTIRDKGLLTDESGNIKEGEDIDISILYEQAQENQIISGFEKFGYKHCRLIKNDIDGKIFHYGFTQPIQPGNPDAALPDICVFAWYLHKGIRYHTYDVNIEKKEIPSEYIFKGVPDELFKDQIDITLKTALEGQYVQLHLPLRYGTLLDLWYPDWLKKRNGVSESPYIQKMKSCNQWKNI